MAPSRSKFENLGILSIRVAPRRPLPPTPPPTAALPSVDSPSLEKVTRLFLLFLPRLPKLPLCRDSLRPPPPPPPPPCLLATRLFRPASGDSPNVEIRSDMSSKSSSPILAEGRSLTLFDAVTAVSGFFLRRDSRSRSKSCSCLPVALTAKGTADPATSAGCCCCCCNCWSFLAPRK